MTDPKLFKFSFGRQIATELVRVDSISALRPTIITWQRLEVLPYSASLGPGLQAQIADPLWLLARQWQFAEFQGEDAGSPIWARLEGESARITRYRPGATGAAAVDYDDRVEPLEVLVEREPVLEVHPRLAAEAGEHLLRLLAAAGVRDVRGALRARFPLDIPDAALPAPDADPRGRSWQALFAGRALDGRAIAAALRTQVDAQGQLAGLPADLDLAPGREQDVLAVARAWLGWYAGHVSEPAPGQPGAWVPQRQEYSLALAARFGDQQVVLAADEYTDGRLDWYSFSAAPGPDLGRPAEPRPAESFVAGPLIPTPVRYPGMPADRLWEFEDARVSLGSLEAGPTDLGRMLLAEFGLAFGNDWFVIPVELEVGSVFRVRRLAVRDTFGVTAEVRPSRNLDGARWTMFLQSSQPGLPPALQDLFFLPPTLPHRLEGEPLEEVALFRDEMANMAWGVEHKVQGAAGEPMDRRMEPPSPSVHQRVDVQSVTAELIYRLMTPVPAQWLPFVAVPPSSSQPLAQFSIGLERRTILRTLEDGTQVEVHPRGILLRTDLSRPVEDEPPLRLFEEEVPREGAVVTRSFQFSRWLSGERLLWVGRRKGAGRGEGASGLRFDLSTYTAERAAPLANVRPVSARRLLQLKRRP